MNDKLILTAYAVFQGEHLVKLCNDKEDADIWIGHAVSYYPDPEKPAPEFKTVPLYRVKE